MSIHSKENIGVEERWDLIISGNPRRFELGLRDLWGYRDLLVLLVQRDFKAVYKQTILGPIWLFIQPILTSLIFTFIFGEIARIGTDGMPSILFYLAGITLWTYFADCFNKTSNTFTANAAIFGKVYFPRLVIPISVLVSNLIKLGIQLTIFLFVWSYYLTTSEAIHPRWELMGLLPFLILIMAGLGLGGGLLISSLTTKYRDLVFLIGFGVQLLMYASSVVLPISSMSVKTQSLMLLNPIVSVIESFKYIFMGTGFFSWSWLVYSALFMTVMLLISTVIFNRTEKSFMDTV
jgi:lipopolysaccharide transport system permease protein